MTQIEEIRRGQRFGHLVVRGPGASDARGAAGWVCDCDCGTRGIWAKGQKLRSGAKTSCGCRGKGK
jgi:hypothetical protein